VELVRKAVAENRRAYVAYVLVNNRSEAMRHWRCRHSQRCSATNSSFRSLS